MSDNSAWWDGYRKQQAHEQHLSEAAKDAQAMRERCLIADRAAAECKRIETEAKRVAAEAALVAARSNAGCDPAMFARQEHEHALDLAKQRTIQTMLRWSIALMIAAMLCNLVASVVIP